MCPCRIQFSFIMETEETHLTNTGQVHLDLDLVENVNDKVPAEDSDDTDEGLGGLGKLNNKSKSNKTRRARRKAFKPYYQLSETEQGVREEREKLRVAKLKERMWAKGRIIAPYNTTQFLMADNPQDDYYYSATPANDQDFLCNEFKKEYEVHNINRLEKMSKEMLLNEYMVLERKNEILEEKLKTIKDREEVGEGETAAAVLGENDPTKLEFASNRMIKLQAELEKIKMENQRLMAENLELKTRLRQEDGNESESEESSSDTDCSTSSSSDGDQVTEDTRHTLYREAQSSDDPGYESNQSKGEIK